MNEKFKNLRGISDTKSFQKDGMFGASGDFLQLSLDWDYLYIYKSSTKMLLKPPFSVYIVNDLYKCYI